ncbi:preprotein translocase, SecE subunit domain protein [Vagococcus fluvialis]|uniref:preprotein translocase, SecE subunit domain protein n=1 Tax=Vagococcus fluvialis TaxID=2738 RepID=UPI003D0C64FB
MALKGGKIYQEMIEIPDEEKGGCGCFMWIILIIAGISLAVFVIDLIIQNIGIVILTVVVLAVITYLIKRK